MKLTAEEIKDIHLVIRSMPQGAPWDLIAATYNRRSKSQLERATVIAVDWAKPIQMADGRAATYLGPIKHAKLTRVIRVSNHESFECLVLRDDFGLTPTPSPNVDGFEARGVPVINVPPPSRTVWLRCCLTSGGLYTYGIFESLDDALSRGSRAWRVIAIVPVTYSDGDGLNLPSWQPPAVPQSHAEHSDDL